MGEVSWTCKGEAAHQGRAREVGGARRLHEVKDEVGSVEVVSSTDVGEV